MSRHLRVENNDEEENLQPWLVTYADMTTLLLCFFVLLFAMSVLNAQKFQMALGSLQGALGIMPGAVVPAPGEPAGALDIQDLQQRIMEMEMRQMEVDLGRFQKELEKSGVGNKVTLAMDERGIIIRFADTVLFDLGKADLRPDARQILDEVAQLLRTTSNPVRVEGHTCNLPIHTPQFASNWELSTARATTVVRYFIEKHGISPERLEAVGYGEYRPIAPNDTEEGRRLNRRVDVVLLRPSLAGQVPKAKTGK